MPNPLIDQGTLNKLRASIVFTNFPQLNVVSANLGKEAIRLALDGPASSYLATMTGAVPSPEPYQIVTVTANLVKSEPIANTFKTQFENSVLLGPVTIRSDAVTLGVYYLINCVLENVREQSYAGEDPVFAVTIKGTYYINTAYFSA